MKRAVVILLAVLMCLSLACCGKTETYTDAGGPEKAEVDYDYETEMKIDGTVKQVNGNTLLIVTDEGSEYVFSFSDSVRVVKGDCYVTVKASDLAGKNVTVIVSKQVQETWPMGLTGEKFIIINE